MVEFELLLAMAVDAPALIPLPHCELDVLRIGSRRTFRSSSSVIACRAWRPLQLEPLTVSLLAHEGANVCRCEREIIGQVGLLLKEPHVAEEVDADLLGRRSKESASRRAAASQYSLGSRFAKSFERRAGS